MQRQQSFSLHCTYTCQVGRSAVWKTCCRPVSSRGSSNQVTATLRRLPGSIYKKTLTSLKPPLSLSYTHSVVSHFSCLCQAMAACYRLLLLLSGKMAGNDWRSTLNLMKQIFFWDDGMLVQVLVGTLSPLIITNLYCGYVSLYNALKCNSNSNFHLLLFSYWFERRHARQVQDSVWLCSSWVAC